MAENQTFVGVPIVSAEDKARVEAREARQKLLAENYPTLRDQFAMSALSGLLSNPAYSLPHETLAKMAYELAEAMLKERVM